MPRILVIYASDDGHTLQLAKAVQRGAKAVPRTTALLRRADSVTAAEAMAADALVLGTPVHMASMHWHMKRFIDDVCGPLWTKDALLGKVGAVFACGGGFGSAGGGSELAMLGMLANLAALGMILVPLPKSTPGYAYGGLHWGAYVRSEDVQAAELSELSEAALASAMHHGAHVARVTAALYQRKIFTRPLPALGDGDGHESRAA